MMRLLLPLWLLGSTLCFPLLADEAPDLAARIRYQDRITSSDGIARENHWQEKWIRVGNQVWSQRRLTLALVFQLQSLSDEDKLRALQLRASRRGLQLSDEVGRFILTRGTRSMSALFELLERLDQASLQAQRKLTIPFLKATLGW